MQREGGERRAVLPVTAHQFGGEVLGLGRAAAVAGDEETGPGPETGGEQGAPALCHGPGVPAESLERLHQFVTVGGVGGEFHRRAPESEGTEETAL